MAFGTLPLRVVAEQAELGIAPRAARGRGARARRVDRDRGRALRPRRGDRRLSAAQGRRRSTGAPWCSRDPRRQDRRRHRAAVRGSATAICVRLAARGRARRRARTRTARGRRRPPSSSAGWPFRPTCSSSADVDRALETAEAELGPVDVWVNNAGIPAVAQAERVIPRAEQQLVEAADGTHHDRARRARSPARRRVAAHARGPPRRHVLRDPRRGAVDGAERHGLDREHRVGVRDRGLRRLPALLRGQGGHPRVHARCREGARRAGRARQCSRAGVHRDAHRRDAGAGGPQRAAPPDPARSVRRRARRWRPRSRSSLATTAPTTSGRR